MEQESSVSRYFKDCNRVGNKGAKPPKNSVTSIASENKDRKRTIGFSISASSIKLADRMINEKIADNLSLLIEQALLEYAKLHKISIKDDNTLENYKNV